AVEPLIAVLKTSDMDVRQSAAKALGQIGDARAMEPLIAALNDRQVQRAAAEALGQIGDARAVEPLVVALKEGTWSMRQTAAQALITMYKTSQLDQGQREIIAALRDRIIQKHTDSASSLSHRDSHSDYSGGSCPAWEPPHTDTWDGWPHMDNGIGVDFPL
ncbi:MAG: HEAT repeat domain-containing protein, partial [Anaerolineales bacterium]|nr:HEAT repeat domain-containing protein [Anaerolineales bacterium]